MTTGSIDWELVIVEASIDVITGAFGGSSIGKFGSKLANAITEGVGSIFGDLAQGNDISIFDAIASATIRALFSSKGSQNVKTGSFENAKKRYKSVTKESKDYDKFRRA